MSFVPEGQADSSQAQSAWSHEENGPVPAGRLNGTRLRIRRQLRPSLRDGAFLHRYPGTSCLATIRLSLRDKSHSPIKGPRIKLALMWLKSWAKIGVGTKVRFAPPSEPDWQISCIRLSSRWLTFKKIGKPQRALVLRKTSQLRKSRYLAIGVDRFHWPGLFVWFGV